VTIAQYLAYQLNSIFLSATGQFTVCGQQDIGYQLRMVWFSASIFILSVSFSCLAYRRKHHASFTLSRFLGSWYILFGSDWLTNLLYLIVSSIRCAASPLFVFSNYFFDRFCGHLLCLGQNLFSILNSQRLRTFSILIEL
jgi:hypothetical protein